jgi:transposase-like protein
MTLEEKVLAQRLFVMRRAQELANVTAACEQLGISRTLFYRWRQRFLRYGADGLKPRPPRRARPGQQASAAVEAAVLGRPPRGAARDPSGRAGAGGRGARGKRGERARGGAVAEERSD